MLTSLNYNTNMTMMMLNSSQNMDNSNNTQQSGVQILAGGEDGSLIMYDMRFLSR